MQQGGYQVPFSQGRTDTNTTSLAGRELPADLVQQVSEVSMGQLFYILGHIQKLSAQAPVTAQALLAENPQICHALLHAECLAGMVEEPSMPLSADELRRAKAKSRQMQDEIQEHVLPQPSAGPLGGQAQPGFSKSPGPLLPPQQLPSVSSSSMPAPGSSVAPTSAAATSTGPSMPGGVPQEQLMRKLMSLTPEQISKLPQNTKVQLLNFLEQHKNQKR
eukprot:TRINITY_DN26236_c0_g1_i1.p1 TRINITY_DN26236_c0_g1~~TRINITY_DN26236_c0_g1_i1.p1  ORF type:complete len:219 (+),score=62.30 TRINITY_DN26236_c0_g1_i1:115-771(+)